MMKPTNITPNCPPPSAFEKIEKYQNKLEEKCFYLNFDNNKYELIISLFDNNYDKEEKIFNFKLIYSQKDIIDNDNIIYYKSNKNTSELGKLFLLNLSKCSSPEKKILEKIEKFHINNNVKLQKSGDSENSINLIYILKTIDNDELKFIIELIKNEEIISKEKKENLLFQEINYLKNHLKNMEKKI